MQDDHGKINKYMPNKPGNLVSVDKLISAHPGLVLQPYGYLTSPRTCACAFFLDSCTGHG